MLQIRAYGLPQPETEFRFHPVRKWRLDVAFPDRKIGVEIEGGVWVKGRHTTGAGFEADAAKYAEAMCIGWRVLRVTPGQIKRGEAIQWLSKILTRPEAVPPR